MKVSEMKQIDITFFLMVKMNTLLNQLLNG